MGTLTAAIRRSLRRLGVDIKRYPAADSSQLQRQRLIQRAAIDVVLDVGANTGQYACELRRFGYRDRIISFEPLRRAFAQLQGETLVDPLWECLNLALGDQDRVAELNVAANSWSSSLLPMCDRHAQSAPDSHYVASETVKVARLDVALPSLVGEKARLLLKLDVQGSELAVLHGAERALRMVEVVETELSLTPLYKGQALAHEIMGFLYGRGFALVSIEEGLRDPTTHELLQFDGIFARSQH
jgi:FkbM family methyltransferase